MAGFGARWIVGRVGDVFAVYCGGGGGRGGCDCSRHWRGVEDPIGIQWNTKLLGEGLSDIVVVGRATDFFAGCGGAAIIGCALTGQIVTSAGVGLIDSGKHSGRVMIGNWSWMLTSRCRTSI